MSSYQIPWKCLDLDTEPTIVTKNHKTFAQAVSNVCEIPVSQLPQPCLKGDELAIMIPENEYAAVMEACKLNLQGRVFWPKGATPLTVVALKNKLAPFWKDLSKWGITSLGKGYYEFVFSTLEDVNRVRSISSWNLNPGILKLFAWSRDFNPRNQQNSSAQVWVRFYGLAQEYWRKNIIFIIAGSLGSPICTDATTSKPRIDRTFRQYVMVLIDMDLSQTIRYKRLVERKGFSFYVDVDYQNLLDYCSHCKNIGHYVDVCKKLNPEVVRAQPRDAPTKQTHLVRKEKTYVQVHDGRGIQGKHVPLINETCSKENEDNRGEKANLNHTPSQKEQDAQLEKEINAALTRENTINYIRLDSDVNEVADLENVAHPNIFNALDDQEDPAIEGEHQIQQGDTDDSSSQYTNFVDATPEHSASQSLDGNQLEDIAERNKRNSAFLKETWANIIDKEETEAAPLQQLEQVQVSNDTQIVPFQIVQKKKHKKKATNIPYQTRSKVLNPKPFK